MKFLSKAKKRRQRIHRMKQLEKQKQNKPLLGCNQGEGKKSLGEVTK